MGLTYNNHLHCAFTLNLYFQLQEEMADDYENLLRVLSTLKFIRDTDNSSDFHHSYFILENLVYDAMCHMNQALKTLGLDIPSQSEITQTTNMCHTEHNLLSEYIRNLEIFRQLKRVANGLFSKYNNYGQITS